MSEFASGLTVTGDRLVYRGAKDYIMHAHSERYCFAVATEIGVGRARASGVSMGAALAMPNSDKAARSIDEERENVLIVVDNERGFERYEKKVRR